MNRFTRSRQRCLGLLAASALVLALALSACGSPANGANTGAPASNPANTQTQQYQPTDSSSTSQNSGSSSGAQNTDQQIQGLLRQLDGAQNDAGNADAGASQDGGQP